MSGDAPFAEFAERLRAGCNRWLKRHRMGPERELHDWCVGFDARALLATPIEQARFVVIDTETTGLAAYGGAELVQVALIEYAGLAPTGREFSRFIRPQQPIPPASTAIHGIDDAMVADAASAEEVIDDVVRFIGEAVLVGHHVAFDLRFINRVLHRRLYCRLPQPTVDTMLLYLAHSGRLGQYDLESVAAACSITPGRRHDARADAATCGAILAALAPHVVARDAPVAQLISRTRVATGDDGTSDQPAM